MPIFDYMATWTLYIETEAPIAMTCADGTGIEKGTLLKLSDPFTVAASDGDTDVIAGVAAEEKIANDGKTKIAVWRTGYFVATCGGVCTVGKSLMSYSSTGDANDVIDGTNAATYSELLGTALETGADGETIIVHLCPGRASTNVLA